MASRHLVLTVMCSVAVLAVIVAARESSSSEEIDSDEKHDCHHPNSHGKFPDHPHHHHHHHHHRHHRPHFRHHHRHHHRHNEDPQSNESFTTTTTTKTTITPSESSVEGNIIAVLSNPDSQPNAGGIDLRATRTTQTPPIEDIDDVLTITSTSTPVPWQEQSTNNLGNSNTGLGDFDDLFSGGDSGVFQIQTSEPSTVIPAQEEAATTTTTAQESTLNSQEPNSQTVDLNQILSGAFGVMENQTTAAPFELDINQILGGTN